jgi:hypothetical protein
MLCRPTESPAYSCAVEYKAPDLMVLRRYHYRSTWAACKDAAQVLQACKTAAPAEAYMTGVLEDARAVPVEATTALAEEKV